MQTAITFLVHVAEISCHRHSQTNWNFIQTCIVHSHIQNLIHPFSISLAQWRQCDGTRGCYIFNILHQVIELSEHWRVVGVGARIPSKKNIYVWFEMKTNWPFIQPFSFLFSFKHFSTMVSVEKNPTIKFVGAEIKRLTKLMQFVVNDMFHNNYLFRFSQKNLLRIFLLFANTYTLVSIQRNFSDSDYG